MEKTKKCCPLPKKIHRLYILVALYHQAPLTLPIEMRLFVQEDPYTMSSGSDLEGFCMDLISELSKALGFKYKVHLVKDNRYGTSDSSGNWNGMVGEIIRGVSRRHF